MEIYECMILTYLILLSDTPKPWHVLSLCYGSDGLLQNNKVSLLSAGTNYFLRLRLDGDKQVKMNIKANSKKKKSKSCDCSTHLCFISKELNIQWCAVRGK